MSDVLTHSVFILIGFFHILVYEFMSVVVCV